MQKHPREHYKVHPGKIIEDVFDGKQNRVSESIFSLANEYMGIRGFAEEGTSAESLTGCYFNGIYEVDEDPAAPAYKGVVRTTHFLVNAVNWLYTRIRIDDEPLDLARMEHDDFERILDFASGTFTRSFLCETRTGKRTRFIFRRFLDMENVHHAYQQIVIEALDDVSVEVVLGLDAGVSHGGREGLWEIMDKEVGPSTGILLSRTQNTRFPLLCGYRVNIDKPAETETLEERKRVGHRFCFRLAQEEKTTIEKRVTNVRSKNPDRKDRELRREGKDILKDQESYASALSRQRDHWRKKSEETDIVFAGDEKNQQGIRFCIRQLLQTYTGKEPGNNIGAKGLTGEVYNGHAFWDTETYCFPFYLFNDPQAARSLLLFRYRTLEQAKERAGQLDCEGACYPVATLNGHEGSTLWQHANLQLQPSTAVAHAIRHYVRVTNDETFLRQYGLEILMEICKFLLSRGQWNSDNTKFGYYGVMGPDEFQMMVNNNAYTNFMAKKTFDYTLSLVGEWKDEEVVKSVLDKTGVDKNRLEEMETAKEHIIVPFDDKRKLFEQHEGYFDLPHVDISAIPTEEFPLYAHWSYDRLFRNDMIKQPDVLMFLFLYNREFSEEIKRANYEFYEPRTIHESSLSPSVHSILALELGKIEEGTEFFRFATRMDLDDYNKNTHEGLHMTSMAAAWMNIVYGFGGLRSDGERLHLSPVHPGICTHYSFPLCYREGRLRVEITEDEVTVTNSGDAVTIELYDETLTVEDSVSRPLRRRG